MEDDAFHRAAKKICATWGCSWDVAVQNLRLALNDPHAGGPILEHELPIEEQVRRREARDEEENMKRFYMKALRNPLILYPHALFNAALRLKKKKMGQI